MLESWFSSAYPANMTGWFILNSLVSGVEKIGCEAGIVDCGSLV